MVLKSLIFHLLLIIVPDFYLYWRYFRAHAWWQQLLWSFPSLCLAVAAIWLTSLGDFVPDNMIWLNLYLLFFALVAGGKLSFSLGTFCGKRGKQIGFFLVLLEWVLVFWGAFVGVRQLEVRHLDLAFNDLPAAFDGYRIVHFTDLHLGSSDKDYVCEIVDSINAQHPDVVVFTGDIQNKQPSEIQPYRGILSGIKALDGVFSVQGNHDYAMYIDAPYYQKAMNEELTVGAQQDMGWTVLANYHQFVYRGGDSIVIAGMENDGNGRFPHRGNINNALWGVSRSQFVVMLEHDPVSWRNKILTHSHCQLTLSGHTHGMQFSLFGWCPLSLLKTECNGLYHMGERMLFVSKGAGALVPFRFGCNPEVVVITLRKKQSSAVK